MIESKNLFGLFVSEEKIIFLLIIENDHTIDFVDRISFSDGICFRKRIFRDQKMCLCQRFSGYYRLKRMSTDRFDQFFNFEKYQ